MANNITTKRYSIDSLQEIQKVANILKSYIIKNNLFLTIAGKKYVMVEGWQFAGGLMGLFPRIVKVENIGNNKWLAEAEIIDKRNDKVVSTGFAICSKDEVKKRTFDEYAILSMAQTRAIGKAYRNLIGWVVKMSGYEPTPAEEMKESILIEQVAKNKNKDGKTNFLEQLKREVYKAGARSEKEAIDIINKKTGLKINSLNMSEKHAEIVLKAYLGIDYERNN